MPAKRSTRRTDPEPKLDRAALLAASGTALARWIASGLVKSREVVEAHIARIEAVNGRINAMVANRFERALLEADKADARALLANEELPPFHGVPCTIKESFALEGMPQTSGLVARQGTIALDDAVTVARLREAGAIPLGVTNVSELCMWYESHNRVYGMTNNPYDARCTAGGSSGGEGSIIGAGGSPFGLGADIGGSIRMPAFFNGVFGHKPTGGVVPNSGQFPNAHGKALRILATGPMARRAEDLMPLLRLMAGPDGEDSECAPAELGDPDEVTLEGLPVLVVEDNGVARVHPELVEAQAKAARWLADRGARVRTQVVARLASSFDIWSAMLFAAGGPTFSSHLGGGQPISRIKEIALFAAGRSRHTLPSLALSLLEDLPKLMPGRSKKFFEKGLALKAELVERIGAGIMLFPPFPRPAPRHYHPLRSPLDFVYTAIINAMELPATAVPLGIGSEGLPLGVQVVGGPLADHVTIRVAMELERAFGGWVDPESIRK